MIDVVEIASAASVLSPKRRVLNELFLASYHLSSYGGCEFGCPYCDGWAQSETSLNAQIQVFPDHPARLAQELVTISPTKCWASPTENRINPLNNITGRHGNCSRSWLTIITLWCCSPKVLQPVTIFLC
ncbi:MAG: hypothetical protein GY846_11050 [Deltaproteobacteria bacterium]|nr:hypothetical protein [Deltaproteobacteria bacterium]